MPQNLQILKLDAGNAFGQQGRAMAISNMAAEDTTILDQYKLTTTDLSPYNVLVVTDFIDQEYLFEQRDVILDFLNAGKIVIASTHIFRAWLPNVNFFMPKPIFKHSDYELVVANDSTIFEGVDMQELAYRKQVSGFYARGYHPVTVKDAEVLLTFTDGTPITYVDRTSTNGTMLVHSARDLLSYATGDNTTSRITPQTKEWLKEELQRLSEGK